MRKKINLLLFFSLLVVTSCDDSKNYKELRKPHIVLDVKKHVSKSVHDEMNLKYDMVLDDSTCITLNKPLSVGDTIWYTYLVYNNK